MNRRSFFKFLGIGAATAAVAPKLLMPQTPKIDPLFNLIDAETLEQVHAHTFQSPQLQKGSYKYVLVAPTTVAFRTGDMVRYKVNKRGETIAYRVPKSPKWNKDEYYGIAINNAMPGYYTFILVSNMGSYDDAMEKIVVTIDKQLRLDANL
jgi:tRNA A37 threonylcarbamoyladenosine synthetase subunit TsaC/SUA5/YrdC